MRDGDVDVFELEQPGFGVTLASLRVPRLPVDQLAGGMQEPFGLRGWRQGQRIDQGVGRHVNLRHGDLGIFPPAAGLLGVPETDG